MQEAKRYTTFLLSLSIVPYFSKNDNNITTENNSTEENIDNKSQYRTNDTHRNQDMPEKSIWDEDSSFFDDNTLEETIYYDEDHGATVDIQEDYINQYGEEEIVAMHLHPVSIDEDGNTIKENTNEEGKIENNVNTNSVDDDSNQGKQKLSTILLTGTAVIGVGAVGTIANRQQQHNEMKKKVDEAMEAEMKAAEKKGKSNNNGYPNNLRSQNNHNNEKTPQSSKKETPYNGQEQLFNQNANFCQNPLPSHQMPQVNNMTQNETQKNNMTQNEITKPQQNISTPKIQTPSFQSISPANNNLNNTQAQSFSQQAFNDPNNIKPHTTSSNQTTLQNQNHSVSSDQKSHSYIGLTKPDYNSNHIERLHDNVDVKKN